MSLVKPAGDPIPKKQTAMVRDIWDGIAYISRQRILVVLLLVGLVTTILAMPFRFILPVFVVDIYRQEADSMGLADGDYGLRRDGGRDVCCRHRQEEQGHAADSFEACCQGSGCCSWRSYRSTRLRRLSW